MGFDQGFKGFCLWVVFRGIGNWTLKLLKEYFKSDEEVYPSSQEGSEPTGEVLVQLLKGNCALNILKWTFCAGVDFPNHGKKVDANKH
jgi:hypothetical protein